MAPPSLILAFLCLLVLQVWHRGPRQQRRAQPRRLHHTPAASAGTAPPPPLPAPPPPLPQQQQARQPRPASQPPPQDVADARESQGAEWQAGGGGISEADMQKRRAQKQFLRMEAISNKAHMQQGRRFGSSTTSSYTAATSLIFRCDRVDLLYPRHVLASTVSSEGDGSPPPRKAPIDDSPHTSNQRRDATGTAENGGASRHADAAAANKPGPGSKPEPQPKERPAYIPKELMTWGAVDDMFYHAQALEYGTHFNMNLEAAFAIYEICASHGDSMCQLKVA
eukprot:CAMPEP_0177684004 /NCGR_PEP_ID=MMETSP0447-20121125/32159_1 /TAXON_ID=0 /ORGANISM="Stygamoeba regulata, Strain BSH-02190019" /LENGTH=280 /DNA_ID=CAMNT_0019193741 /DNA_START=72 /DNA_END=912 /DNA_ORIENTATION=+